MRVRNRHGGFALLTTCCTIAFAPAGLAVTTDPLEGGAAGVGGAAEVDAPSVHRPSEDERAVRTELRELERAWADGGGTFGYPFWEKAGQRRHSRQITPSMYREYVTGYRDRLVVGCALVEQVDANTDVAREVREHVLGSCEMRVTALRAQQRSLDVEVRSVANDPDVDVAKLDEQRAEHDLEVRESLQGSYRLARIAMDVAQAELDRTGQERLAEDAFI